MGKLTELLALAPHCLHPEGGTGTSQQPVWASDSRPTCSGLVLALRADSEYLSVLGFAIWNVFFFFPPLEVCIVK